MEVEVSTLGQSQQPWAEAWTRAWSEARTELVARVRVEGAREWARRERLRAEAPAQQLVRAEAKAVAQAKETARATARAKEVTQAWGVLVELRVLVGLRAKTADARARKAVVKARKAWAQVKESEVRVNEAEARARKAEARARKAEAKAKVVAEAFAVAGAWAWARGQARERGERMPATVDTSTIWHILTSLNRSGVASDLWDRSHEKRLEYSSIIHFISPITRLPLELLHQIFLITIDEANGPPLALMLICKHWYTIVTSIWASLSLGTRTPPSAVTSKLERSRWLLDIDRRRRRLNKDHLHRLGEHPAHSHEVRASLTSTAAEARSGYRL